MSVFDRYLEQAKDFARKLVRAETGTRRWATVTSVDPILITYDGPAPQGIISPVVLGTPVTIGDRVRAHTIHDRTYITRANPTRDPGIPYAMAAGSVEITGTGTHTASAAVTFPAGRFTVTPLVPSIRTNNINFNTSWQSVGPGGFTVFIRRPDLASFTNTVTVHWEAVQMTADSAEG